MEPDIEKVRGDWNKRGFGCDVWTDPPGQVWNGYVHPVDELLMVVQGRLELEIDGKPVQPKTGEEIFIPAHACHTVRNIGGTTARWLYGYRGRT
ncbi:MAG TPA: cupin domain-containing protein [Candidatus Binataceae bacterium]|nr:cupin domain-containing protein [Candidatus Binataceae bacterium]